MAPLRWGVGWEEAWRPLSPAASSESIIFQYTLMSPRLLKHTGQV